MLLATGTGAALVIAIAAALAASLAFAVSAVIEQRTAHQVPQRRTLAPALLVDLARQRIWLLAIAATLIGVACQVTALHFGPLALVQPISVCDLIFAVLIAAFVLRRRAPDPVLLGGVIAAAAGAAFFLAIASPSGGESVVSASAALPLAIALAAAMAGCLALSRRRRTGPLALALACGIAYGVTAFLFKLVAAEFTAGPAAPLAHWPVYALAVIGPVGFLLNQNAFQQGQLIAPVLAVITAADPLVAIVIAHFMLSEQIAGTAADVAGEVASLLLMVAGIFALAHRAPQVARQLAAEEEPPGPVPAGRAAGDGGPPPGVRV